MPFVLRDDCPCCRANHWHCPDCWNNFHNGLKDKDFVPAKYLGQSLLPEEVLQKYHDIMAKK